MTSIARTNIWLAAGCALALAQLAAPAAQATDYNVGPIQITAPWARATPKGASTGAAYMTITNTGKTPDKVSCVSSDASAECQIHTMTMNNGVMQMRPVEGGLEIKPGETVTLKPGGLHVMLVNLKHPLEQGKHGEDDAEVRQRRLGGRRLSDRRHRRRRAGRSRRRRHHADARRRGRRRHADEQAVTRRYLPSLNGAFMPCGSGALKVLSVIDTMA